MNSAVALGEPVILPVETGFAPAPRCGVGTIGAERESEPEAPTSRRWKITAFAAAAIVIVLALLLQSTMRAGMTNAPLEGSVALSVAVAGFAEVIVTEYLSASFGHTGADAFFATAPDLSTMSAGERYVSSATAMSIESAPAGTWLVVVAADLLVRTKEGYVPAGLAYYSVPVGGDSPGTLKALALPSRVAGSSTSITTPGNLQPGGAVDPAVGTVAAAFVEAYLTQPSLVESYVVPESRITVFSTAPYASVEIIRVDSGQWRASNLIRVQVVATDEGGRREALTYTLEVADTGAGPKVRGFGTPASRIQGD